jgi:hypothetical protein
VGTILLLLPLGSNKSTTGEAAMDEGGSAIKKSLPAAKEKRWCICFE